ncbi:MAG: biotin--[acetyl-CoA-carboxylase] ligase [Proteobacteria bacterium]|nr:biotin--[acetyl-CoA-carboxylase] ligase [Pseudomonadota bacterium]
MKRAKQAARPEARGRPAAHAARPLVRRVFAELADGGFHSGEALARSLGVSRSAVWKAVRALKALGAPLEAVRNRGYCLPGATPPLEAELIRKALPRAQGDRVSRIDVEWTLDSTNSRLLARANPPPGTSEVLLAEVQTSGRGRRGRQWLAPPGGSICLSFSWTFREVPRELGALGLVIGVCALRALRAHGVPRLELKWPNDLLMDGRKLGGVLIELRAESTGPACVVIGIGLNVALGASVLGAIAATGIAAADLASALHRPPDRNEIVAAVVGECLEGLAAFEREGLKPFIEHWRAADALAGRPVAVSGAQGTAQGLARGIDLHGALLLETREGVQRFISGDVSVRPAVTR